MNITPLKKYAAPEYPTRTNFCARPELLARHVPSMWLNKQLVAGALAAFIVSGCKGAGDTAKAETTQSPTAPGAIDKDKKQQQQQQPVSAAPIFVHGEGSGAEGCQVMLPPVFISEAEARKIINRELEKEGITIDKTDVAMPDIVIEQMREDYRKVGNDYKTFEQPTGNKTTFVLDGYDTKLNLGYEFVSVDDYYDLGGMRSGSTVQSYDLKELAEKLGKKLADDGKMNTVVFYDPAVLTDDPEIDALFNKHGDWTPAEQKKYEAYQKKLYKMDYEERDILLQKRAEQELTAQVRDFIEWMKKEKILEKAND